MKRCVVCRLANDNKLFIHMLSYSLHRTCHSHSFISQTIKETILASYPHHDFLGEEDVPPGAEASAAAIDEKLKNNKSGFLWIVDPIDGTVSFIAFDWMYWFCVHKSVFSLSNNLSTSIWMK